ncbi:MAG: DUF4835 family protein [Calditrichaceae bacterium]
MKISMFSIIIILALYLVTSAQALKVTADVEYEHLQSDEQKILSDFGYKIEQYFNNYEWIEDEFEYDVECQVQIIFMNVRQTHERLFSAQFVLTSNSGEAFLDKNWEFPYDPGTSMNHIKGMFDPLTHVLDYYAYMTLAGEMDTNGPFLGEPEYNMARDIIEQGLRSEYPRGWKDRLEEYNIEGIEEVYKVTPNNKYLNMFFNSHYRQLAVLFQQQNKYLNQLVEFDSKHRETYRKYMRE